MSKIKELFAEVENLLRPLSKSLPSEIRVAEISTSAKIPYKAVLFREALLWRLEELANSSRQSYVNGNIASGIILTRATFECAGAMFYFHNFIVNCNKNGVSKDADTKIMRLLLGAKNNSELPNPIHVNDYIKELNKQFDGAQRKYDGLSEYAHPNWSGTAMLFSKNDEQSMTTYFGKNPREKDFPIVIGLSALAFSLRVASNYYNRLAEILPTFVEICEADLKNVTPSPEG